MLSIKDKRDIWMKPALEHKELLENRAKTAIEKYRKGYGKIKFVDESGNPLVGKKVKITQKNHDFKHGANIFMLDEFETEAENKRYREEFKKYFNLATVPFYWNTLEPQEGKPRYDKNSPKIYRRPAPDLCVEYCEENGIDAKLHCLVYEAHLPNWLPKKDMTAMEKHYEERFRQISERYSGRMWEFEVFNELLFECGWNDQSVISSKRDIIDWAFNLARKYFPNEKLITNEGSSIPLAGKDDYRNSYFMMLEGALARGVKMDKIGIQHHDFRCIDSVDEKTYDAAVKRGGDNFNPDLLFKGLDVFAELGLPLELTEITIPTFGDTEEDEELQADLLETLYTVCFGHPSVDAVVYWNSVDGHAYKAEGRNWDENLCRGGLLHKDLTPKKSAERLWYLFNKKWHTDLELAVDTEGYVDFRGFYGEYEAEIDGKVYNFGLHKSTDNTIEIKI